MQSNYLLCWALTHSVWGYRSLVRRVICPKRTCVDRKIFSPPQSAGFDGISTTAYGFIVVRYIGSTVSLRLQCTAPINEGYP